MMGWWRKYRRQVAGTGVIWWVGPQGGQWWPRAPRSRSEPVLVVADVIEESIAHIDVPSSLIGWIRTAYVRTQLEFVQPGVELRAVWPSVLTWWPKAARLVVFGLDSPVVSQAIEAVLTEERPVAGVWTITQRLLRAAGHATDDRLLALPTPNGLRLLLIVDGEARFTRLIVGSEAQQWQTELAATVRYARDQRWIARERPIGLEWFGDARTVPVLSESDCVVRVVPTPDPAGQPWWAWLLARTRVSTPGQLAPPWIRRYALLQWARRLAVGVNVLGVLGALGAGAWTGLEAWQYWDTRQTVMQQVERRQAQVEAIRQRITASGVDVDALKLALHWHDQKPPEWTRAPSLAWSTADWIQAGSGLRLVGVRWQRTGAACAQSTATPTVSGATNAQQAWELRLSADPLALPDLGRREKAIARVSETLLRADPWRLEVDPVAVRASRILGNQRNADADTVEWCLSGRIEPVQTQ